MLSVSLGEAGHVSWFEVDAYPDRIFRLREPGLAPLAAAHAWLILGDARALLVDAGTGVAPLAPLVRGLTPLPVTLLLTHTHYDHIGGAHEFSTRCVHALEAPALAAPTSVSAMWEGWLTRESFGRLPHPDFDVGAYSVRPAPPSLLVADGDTIELGGRILEIKHAPGHSPGLVCCFERATATLFSSDALYDGEMFFDLPGSDRRAAARSLEALRALAPAVVHPGHFESFGGERVGEVIERARGEIGRVHST